MTIDLSKTLDAIRNATADAQIPVATALRQCRILAQKMNMELIKQWVANELNGYDRLEDIPEYRISNSENVYGNFVHPSGLEYRDFAIPIDTFPEDLQKSVTTVYLGQPAEYLESIINRQGTAHKIMFPPGLSDAFSALLPGIRCVAAWYSVSPAVFMRALEGVRNRTLEFVLEAEQILASAANNPEQPPREVQEKLQSVFNMHIYGNAGNVGNITSSDAALTIQSPGAQTASGGQVTQTKKSVHLASSSDGISQEQWRSDIKELQKFFTERMGEIEGEVWEKLTAVFKRLYDLEVEHKNEPEIQEAVDSVIAPDERKALRKAGDKFRPMGILEDLAASGIWEILFPLIKSVGTLL